MELWFPVGVRTRWSFLPVMRANYLTASFIPCLVRWIKSY
jgi:hypothetical protein